MFKLPLIFFLIFCHSMVSAEKVENFKHDQESQKAIYQSSLICQQLLSTDSFQKCEIKLMHAGKLLKKTEVFIDGAMPAHEHGLPTAPRVNWSKEKNTHLIHGLKFSMPGNWTLKFKVNAAEAKLKDTIVMALEVN